MLTILNQLSNLTEETDYFFYFDPSYGWSENWLEIPVSRIEQQVISFLITSRQVH